MSDVINPVLPEGFAGGDKNPPDPFSWTRGTPLSFTCILVESMDVVVHYSTRTMGLDIYEVYCPPVK